LGLITFAVATVAAGPAKAEPLFKAPALVFDAGQDAAGTPQPYGDQRVLAARDLNGDGRADMVVPNQNSAAGAGTGNTISALLSHTDAAPPYLFLPKTNYTVGPGPTQIALEDVNNDRLPDAVTYNRGDSTVTVLIGDGLGHFGARIDTDADMFSTSLNVGDVNADGFADVVLGALGGAARSFLGNGTGSFTPASVSAANTGDGDLADVDQDGFLDIFGPNVSPAGVRVCLGLGNGAFAAPILTTTSIGVIACKLADYDLDGFLDAALAGQTAMGVPHFEVLQGFGNGTFSGLLQSLPLPDAFPYGMGMGDLDLDGIPEAVMTINHAPAVKGEGVNTVAIVGGFTVYLDGGGELGVPVLGDFDGDGLQDIAATNFLELDPGVSGSHAVSVLLTGVEFGGGYHIPVTHDPAQVSIADLNRDGKADMIVSAGEARLDVYIGNGAGGWFPPIAVPTTPANAPGRFAVGDVNRDGTLDIVPSAANILFGVGDGTFTTGGAPGATGQVMEESLVDLNRDGFLDLVRLGGSQITLLYGLPGGTFGSAVGYSVPSGPRSLTVADWNRDGISDLALATVGGIKVFFGNPDGSLAGSPLIEPGRGFHDVTSGDFNRDGKLDLAARDEYTPGDPADHGGISVFLGDGATGFGTRTAYTTFDRNGYEIASWDVNRDGSADLVAANHEFLDGGLGDGNFWTVGAWLGNGAGAFTRDSDYLTGVGSVLPQMAVGDINRDGQPDIMGHCADYANDGIGQTHNVTFLRANLPPFPQGLTHTIDVGTHLNPWMVRAGDFNRDGKPDLLSLCGADNGLANEVTLRLGNGNGTFGATVTDTIPLGSVDFDVADFNRDGKLDFVTVTPSTAGYPTIAVVLGNGAGGFGTQNHFGSASYWAVGAGDVNRDGKPDVIAYWNLGSEVHAFLGNGDGTFQAPLASPELTPAMDLVIFDLDRDGKLDVITLGSFGITTCIGNGDGTFQLGATNQNCGSDHALAVGDMNRDGYMDVLAECDATPPGIVINSWTNEEGWLDPVVFSASGSVTAIAVHDWNGDGSLDVVASTNSALNLWYGNGFGGLGTRIDISAPSVAYSLAAGDWDRDGRPDVAATRNSGMVSIYENGVFVPSGVTEQAPLSLPRLSQNFPNPFNPRTTIEFTLVRGGPARLEVFDVRGRRVAVLVDRELPLGDHRVEWAGKDSAGRDVASGVYFYRLDAGEVHQTRRMVLVK
jgi:hypothetical protein